MLLNQLASIPYLASIYKIFLIHPTQNLNQSTEQHSLVAIRIVNYLNNKNIFYTTSSLTSAFSYFPCCQFACCLQQSLSHYDKCYRLTNGNAAFSDQSFPYKTTTLISLNT